LSTVSENCTYLMHDVLTHWAKAPKCKVQAPPGARFTRHKQACQGDLLFSPGDHALFTLHHLCLQFSPSLLVTPALLPGSCSSVALWRPWLPSPSAPPLHQFGKHTEHFSLQLGLGGQTVQLSGGKTLWRWAWLESHETLVNRTRRCYSLQH